MVIQQELHNNIYSIGEGKLKFMSLRLIYGRAGTGKSQFCLNKIKEQINNKTAQKIYLVVPEQFSFSTEKRLLETLEQNSVINA